MISSKDVAKMAGVSQATVSRVLNNPQSVKPATREKVLKAMEKLKYRPNLIARSLVTKSTKTIALISGSLTNGFFVETTDSIINFATRHGYNTMVFFEESTKSKDVFYTALGNKVDGILLSSIMIDDHLFEEIEKSGIPYMFFNRRHRKGGNYVVQDNILAGKLLTQHLLNLGHQRIAYITGKTTVSTFLERRIGFQEAMKEANLEIDPQLVFVIDPLSIEVEKVTIKLMNLADPPTAIICATDAMAFTCMDTVMSMGLRIPDDLSLVGIDDIKMSSHHAIQLTSIGHQKHMMGELAAEYLIEMIEQGEAPKGSNQIQIVLKPELIIRKTTARKR